MHEGMCKSYMSAYEFAKMLLCVLYVVFLYLTLVLQETFKYYKITNDK